MHTHSMPRLHGSADEGQIWVAESNDTASLTRSGTSVAGIAEVGVAAPGTAAEPGNLGARYMREQDERDWQKEAC
jgi:hypothetical protein